jgi:hypothetical protein
MVHAHFCQFGRGPAGDLLHAEGEELLLEVYEELRQVILRPMVFHVSVCLTA